MKPANSQKERIIVIVSTLLLRSGLGIDQVVARMQVDGCNITRNTFENRFTTRVHQKPNIPPDWLISLLRSFTQNLTEEERCQPDEALELFQLARLPLESISSLRELFPEQKLNSAIERLIPISYANTAQTASKADNLLTKNVGKLSASRHFDLSNSTDLAKKHEWGDAPDTTSAIGRQGELAEIVQWIQEKECRLVSIFGMSGAGKTLLAAQLARRLQASYERIYWYSLRNAPTLQQLLTECLHFFVDDATSQPFVSIQKASAQVISEFRQNRCLLILDGYDALKEAGDVAGTYRLGYENYAHWLRQIAELPHQSCIILTSREKLLEFVPLPPNSGPVHSIFLQGIDLVTLRTMLEPQGIYGTLQEWQQIHRRYSGNPAALKLAAEPIRELFGGSLAAFLESDVSLFQGVRALLDEQFGKLSLLEREVLYWLSIEREPVDLGILQNNIGTTVPKLPLLEALRSLLRRSLIEQHANHFAIPLIIQTYMSERLIELVVSEIGAGIPLMLAGFALLKTQIKEYLREAQRQEITQSILTRLLRFESRQELEGRLLTMLHSLQQNPSYSGSYCAGNLLNLLAQLNGDLRGCDFSHLEVQQGDLRITNLQDTNFTNATFHGSRFWESFTSIAALDFHPNGAFIAAGMTTGELYLWSLKDWGLFYYILSHSDMIWSVAFSADGTLLVTGSEDHTVCIWDVASGECLLRVVAHDGWVKAVTFLHGNAQLVTAGHDANVRIWDITSGECIQSWVAHDGWIWSISASPDGRYLATAGQDHTVKLWDLTGYHCVRVLSRHTEPVRTVTFSPDGRLLLSAGFDRLLIIWEVATGECRHILAGHENLIWAAVFSPNGEEIVSGGDDAQIFVWNSETGQLLRTLDGHQNRLWALAYHPNGDMVASGGDDQRLRFWEPHRAQPLYYIEGYSNQIWAVAYHSRGQLVAGGDDGTIRLWNYQSGECIDLLRGHSERIRGITFSPDGLFLATSGDDNTVRIWDITHNVSLQTLTGHQNRVWSISYDAGGERLISCSEDQTIRIWDLASGKTIRTLYMESGRIWSIACHPSENLLISGGDGHELLLWDIDSGQCLSAWEGHSGRVWHLAFNHDGSLVASGGADNTVCIWETRSGKLLQRLTEHEDAVWAVAFSPDSRYLASGGDDSCIRVWDVQQGGLCYEFEGHKKCIWSLCFIDNQTLASGGQDETIRIWHLEQSVEGRILRSERPYERMNITGVQGLTEAQKMSLRSLGAIER